MKKVYEYKITVVGSGIFPFDMLRYDRCIPTKEKDSFEIGNQNSEEREITLSHMSLSPAHNIGSKRWKSFGWKIIDIEKNPF